MNAKKLSAVLTAALLAGALSTTALAADRLPTGDASVTFKKAIDMTDAAGAGGVQRSAAPTSLPAPPSQRSLPGGLTAALPPRAMSPCSSI